MVLDKKEVQMRAYTYTACLAKSLKLMDDNIITLWALPILFSVILLETLTLPIFPLVYKRHVRDLSHKEFCVLR